MTMGMGMGVYMDIIAAIANTLGLPLPLFKKEKDTRIKNVLPTRIWSEKEVEGISQRGSIIRQEIAHEFWYLRNADDDLEDEARTFIEGYDVEPKQT